MHSLPSQGPPFVRETDSPWAVTKQNNLGQMEEPQAPWPSPGVRQGSLGAGIGTYLKGKGTGVSG